MQVTVPDNDVVDEVPVFGLLMHPRSVVHVAEPKGVCDGKTEFTAEREQPRTLVFMLPTP